MRVLVTGSRHWTDTGLIWDVLNAVLERHPEMILIEGGAKGADHIAQEWAEFHGVQCLTFPANWEIDSGRAAGPIRNKRMLVEGKPDIVLAFSPDITKSKGTKNMVDQATKFNVPVQLFSRRIA